MHATSKCSNRFPRVCPPASTWIGQLPADLVEIGLASANGLLTETEAKSLIAAYGIPVNPTTAAASADEAGSIAQDYGFPVVMKILSRDIIHKSDVGGVALDLKTADEVKTDLYRYGHQSPHRIPSG